MRLLPIALFWALIFIGKRELGYKGIIFCVVLWFCLLFGFNQLNLPSYWFVAAQVLIDVVLIIIICGGDIRIR